MLLTKSFWSFNPFFLAILSLFLASFLFLHPQVAKTAVILAALLVVCVAETGSSVFSTPFVNFIFFFGGELLSLWVSVSNSASEVLSVLVQVSVGVLGAPPMSLLFFGSGTGGGTTASFASTRTRSVRVLQFPVLLPFPQFFSLLSMACASATPNTSAVAWREICRTTPRVQLSKSCGMMVPAGSALAFHSSHRGTTNNYFHKFDFWSIFDFALTVLGIDVSAADSQGSFSP